MVQLLVVVLVVVLVVLDAILGAAIVGVAVALHDDRPRPRATRAIAPRHAIVQAGADVGGRRSEVMCNLVLPKRRVWPADFHLSSFGFETK